MERRWLAIGAGLGLLLVVLGAFGAHGIKGLETVTREPKILEWWGTAVQYGSWHALAIVLVAALAARGATRALTVAGCCFLAGELLFSGSLFAMAGIEAAGGRARWLGAVTPLGGLAMMAGWVALFVHALRAPAVEAKGAPA